MLLRLRRALTLSLIVIPTLAPRPAAAQTGVLRVEIEGVSGDLRRNVLAHLAIDDREGDRLPEDLVRELHSSAGDQIEAALQPYGFYRPVVGAELTSTGGSWRARYRINPGPALHVDSLNVTLLGEGKDDPEFQRLLATLPVKQGDVLVQPRYEQAKTRFGDTALRHGYLDAALLRSEIRIDLAAYRSAVTIVYDTGIRYVFGRVIFVQDILNPDLLRGYVAFKQGTPVDFDQLTQLERDLGNSPNFKRVTVRPRTDLAQGHEVPIVVELVPSARLRYSLGGGYGTDSGPSLNGRLEVRRVNRHGDSALLDGTLARREKTAVAEYRLPWPWPRSDVLTWSLAYRQTITETAEEKTGIAGVRFTRTPGRWQQSFGLSFNRQHYEVGLDQALATFIVPEAAYGTINANQAIDPSHGTRVSTRAYGASRRLFSDASYVVLRGLMRRRTSINWRHRFLGRLEVGHNWTSEFRSLPPSARFFAGGSETIRGYGYNSLGEHDEAGNVIGGQTLVAAGLEYEFRFRRHWGAAVFYDTGNAMRNFEGPYLSGAGIGGRWVSPVGLLRVDFAWPVSRAGVGPGDMQLHIALGPGL